MSRAAEAALTRERLFWSAGVVLGASLPHWLMLPPWMPALLCAAAAWRIVAERRGWPLPGRAVRVLLAVLVFAVVLTRYRTLNGVEAGGALLVVMVALKLVEAKTQRDEIVLMIIAYFLVFASLLEQQSMLIGAYVLVFVFVTTVGLLQLGRRGPLLPPAVNIKLAARMLLKSLPVMLVLFVLFPRLPGPLWALPNNPNRAATGLDGSMSPGDITELVQSDEAAFRVEFEGEPPPVEQRYWRGPVLAGFSGRTWSRTITDESPAAIEYLGEPVEYRVMLEPGGSGWAFALDLPRTWSEPNRLRLTADYQLVVRSRRDVGARLDYRVASHTRYRADEPPSEDDKLILTRLPADSNPRTLALAAAWRAQGLTEEAIVGAALAYFREQPFSYTLTPAALGAHAADEFLFDTREGFCEHYASAFAVLMRAAGIPARVVTGYQGGELNAFGRYYIVRQSDAHAWTEIWLDEQGWTRVDPTAAIAPERIELGAASSGFAAGGAALRNFGLLLTASYAWDALNTYWYGWIVGYGEAAQRMLLESFGFLRPTLGGMLAAATAGVALILAAFTVYVGVAERRRPARDRAARCFDVFARRLAGRRVEPRAPSETPSAFADRAAQALPESAAAIRVIAGTYLRARYEPDPDGAALQRLERLVRGFRPARH